MGAVSTTQAQKTMSQNATFKKGIKLIFDKIGQPRSGLRFNLCKEGLNVFLHQLIQHSLFRPVPLIVNAIFSRRVLS